ncbi:hypothetical protein BTHERMOSOX_758 [Bathymodiolus thermophilus thioautotrophic gill symbiont]|uniref:Fic family protein n=1 Tax=Bathymodiolus thermophilus thioautotrophic gill symbiont TaxID=2360 RepID=UPI0010BAB69D|nr:hypothetical protein [Bathymodiolus thermophilus thioautotrophic gill symbiont]SHA13513.1 hypothetical protein BTHERMOSOX_758 [Bathymodiolus thermophilus thioautotrophic gill symbiont]
MKIVPPPKISREELFASVFKKIQQGLVPTIVDEKKRYSHWDKIRHLKTPDKFDDIEQYWHFLKYSRLQQQKNLPFSENFSFVLTDDIQQNIHEIDSKMRGSLEAKNIDSNSDRYIVRALIDEAISSSQLEGAATTRKVAREMLKHDKTPNDHSQKMIDNNYHAIKFINEHKQDELTPSLILQLHAIVTKGTMDDSEVGKLRRDNEVNVVDNSTQTILHHPPDFQELPSRLTVLCDFANGNSPDYFVHPIKTPALN